MCVRIFRQSRIEQQNKKRMETLLDNIKKLMEKMGWSAEQSMDMLSISESDRNYLLSIGSNTVTGYCLH